MTDTIEIDGEEYELTDNPSLRTVRKVQNMQMDMIMSYVDEDELRQLDSLEDESEIIDAIMDSGGYQALQDVMWERSMLEPVQTISLACDEVLDVDDVETLPSKDFKNYLENAENELGGDASDFFEELGIGSLLSEEEMEQTASQVPA